MSRILIVGTSEVRFNALRSQITDWVSDPVCVALGAQALESARLAPPDLLVSEIYLPDMDGFDLYEQWQADSRLCAIPFFFLPPGSLPDTVLPNTLSDFHRNISIRQVDSRPVQELDVHQSSDNGGGSDPGELDFLYQTAIELAKLPREADIYQFIGLRLQALLGEGLIIISSFDSQTRAFTIRSVLHVPKQLETVFKLFGRKPEEVVFPLSEAAAKRLLDRKLEPISTDLYELSEGLIPRAICQQAEHVLNLGSAYAIGLMRGQELYGSVSFYLPIGEELKHRDTIETFINQASVALQRRLAEADLRVSESKFRGVIEQSRDGIALLDEQGRVIEWNRALQDISGISRPAAMGEYIWDVQFQLQERRKRTPERLDLLKKMNHDILYNEHSRLTGRVIDTPIYRDDGEIRVMQTIAFRVKTDNSFIIGSIMRDVTEKRKIDGELANQSALNAILAELSARLMMANSLNTITDLTLAAAKTLTSSEAGYVGYIDPQTGELVAPSLTPQLLLPQHNEGVSEMLRSFRGLNGWSLEQKKIVVSNDPVHDVRASTTPHGHLTIQRFLAVPAMQGEALIGQIAVANAPRDYDKTDIQALERLAALYALGVQRMRMEMALRKSEDTLRQSEEKFRTLIEQSAEGIALTNEQGQIIEWNMTLERITGVARETAIGKMFWDESFLTLPAAEQTTGNSPAYIKSAALEALETGSSALFGQAIRRDIIRLTDGVRRSLEETVFPIKTELGYRIARLTSDISERNGAEERRAMLYQATQEISASANREQVCVAIHKAAAQVMPVESLVISLLVNNGTEIEDVYLFDSGRLWPSVRHPVGEGLSSYIILTGKTLITEDLNMVDLVEETNSIEFGEEKEGPLRAIAAPMRWADRTIGMLSVQSYGPTLYQLEDQELIEMLAAYGAIAFENAAKTASLQQEIVEHRQARVELERLAKTDPLTNLLNRRQFFLLAEAEFKQSQRYGHTLSVIMIDTDHFKKINDHYGHTIGDRALMALSDMLTACVRDADIVARYGGEEFVILLPETDAAGAFVLAERIRVQVASSVLHIDDSSLSFTISLGVADGGPSSQCTKFDQVLTWADKALYMAKAHGRNTTVNYWDFDPGPDQTEI